MNSGDGAGSGARGRQVAPVGVLLAAVVAVAVVFAVVGDDDSIDDEAADSMAQEARQAPDAEPISPDPVVPDTASQTREVTFWLEPEQAVPGQDITILGTGCPPSLAWTENSAIDYFVVVGAGVPGGGRQPQVNPPSTEPGHVSFDLVPEYRDARIAQAAPDLDGSWSTTWMTPDPFEGATVVISALCIGGSGLETGSVHYGAEQLTVGS